MPTLLVHTKFCDGLRLKWLYLRNHTSDRHDKHIDTKVYPLRVQSWKARWKSSSNVWDTWQNVKEGKLSALQDKTRPFSVCGTATKLVLSRVERPLLPRDFVSLGYFFEKLLTNRMNARPTWQTSADALIKCVPTGVGIRSCTGTCIRQKNKKIKKKKDGEIDSASLDFPLLFCSLIATSKTLQSLLHSLKTTIDDVLDNAVVCLVCQIARLATALWSWKWSMNVPCRLSSANSTSKSKCSSPVIQPRTKKSFLAAFTTVFSCVWRRPAIRQQPLVSDSSVRPPGAARTLCVLRKSYLLREKTADQVVSGLKLKLKTSPTKVRLVSLKKSWKQAGRSHVRCDVDFAESADFAEFDLRNGTQLNGHSNTCKRGFPLACSMPNFNDVRLKEMPKKRCQKSKKSSSHRAARARCERCQIPVPVSWAIRGRNFPACVHRVQGDPGYHNNRKWLLFARRWAAAADRPEKRALFLKSVSFERTLQLEFTADFYKWGISV